MINPIKQFKDTLKNYKHNPPDWYLVGTVAFLVVFGLAILTSAGAPISFKDYGDSYWHVKHQLFFGFLPGLILFLFFSVFDHRKLRRFTTPLLALSVILLILVFVPQIGSTSSTFSRSWLNINGWSLQPAEIVKLTYLLYLASWLAKRGEKEIKDFHMGFLPFVIILAVIILLLVLQPDLGTMSIIVFTSLAVYFAAGARFTHLIGLSVVGFGSLAILLKSLPRQLARLTVFLHPEIDPKGIGYHINQALLAVGSGGWFGRGFGHSRQKFAYLPEVINDSIFAVMAEEMGFIFSTALVLLFLFLAVRGFKIARECSDDFSRFLTIGIISWFSFQAFLNIGGIIGIMPMTGVPLPFISYGGTAMFVNLAAAGILVNVSRGS